jgi:oxalate---CoA ligase
MKTSQYKSIYHLLKAQAEKNPEAIAMVAPDRASLSYHRLLTHIEETTKKLNSMGLTRNDRIATVLPNGPEMALTFLAVSSVATCAPLNPSYTSSEFDFYFTDLNVKALIVDSDMDSPAIDVAKNKGISIIELAPVLSSEAGIFTLEGNNQKLTIDSCFAESEDIALVLHTSGTTSRPKIVPLTHANICASAGNIQMKLNLTENDRCLNIMPLFHIHGLIGSLLSSLSAGSSIVLTHGFSALRFFDWMAEFNPTWYTAVPTMHQAILAKAENNQNVISHHSLRFIRSCSSALPVRVMSELEDVFGVPVIEAYGMTEASHQVASNPLPPDERKFGSVGLSAGSDMAIMDEYGNILPSGKNGEIVIRGENVMKGYENNPDANRIAFVNGWFRTGDQGYLDDDNYLFITGRIKEIINRGGEKISPREIDDVLMEHPAIAQAVTFSIPHAQLGEDIAAVVVFHKDYSDIESGIKGFVAKRLANFKIPRRIIIVDEIPKGPTGKPQRIGMAEKLGIMMTDYTKTDIKEKFTPPRTHIEKKLVAIWSQILEIKRIGIHDNFFYLGGDSLLAAQVIVRIRSEINIDISLMDFFDKPTIANIASIIETTNPIAKKQSSVLVTIQSGKENIRPLFCIHGCDGNVLIYSSLIRYLSSDQPVYGLRMQGLYGEKTPHSRFDDMVSHYVREIRSVQPKGPYQIIGVRDGGWVAIEIGCQLLKQGEKVSNLILIETRYLKLPITKNIPNTSQSNISKDRAFESQKPQNVGYQKNLSYYFHRSFYHLRHGQLIQILTKKMTRKLKKTYKIFARKCYWRFAYTSIPRHTKYIQRHIDYERYIRQKYARVLFKHTPNVYSYKAVLFSSEERLDVNKNDGWNEIITGDFDFVVIPGGHYSMWREPNIQVMAEKLQSYLDSV